MKARRLLTGFVLTPEEKRAITFVLIMFLVGVGTMQYRAKHFAAPSGGRSLPAKHTKSIPATTDED